MFCFVLFYSMVLLLWPSVDHFGGEYILSYFHLRFQIWFFQLRSKSDIAVSGLMQYNTAYCIWEDDTHFFSVLPLISALAVPLNVSYQVNCLWIVQYVIWPVNPLVMGPFLYIPYWEVAILCRCYAVCDSITVNQALKKPQIVVLTEAVQEENKNSYPE